MGKKIVGVLFVIVGAVFALITATTAAEYRTGIEWVFAVVFVALGVFLILKGGRKSGGRQPANGTFMSDQDLQVLRDGGLPALAGVPVVLGEGETAHFFAPAKRYITKKKAVGRTGKSGGVSVRVAKGVSVRSGTGASKTVYGDVTDVFDGQVVLTDRRVVFLAKQNGFDCPLSSVSAITPEGDRVMIQAGAKSYRLSVPQQGLFAAALDRVVRA